MRPVWGGKGEGKKRGKIMVKGQGDNELFEEGKVRKMSLIW